MTAVFCRAAADRKAATWEGLLAPFPRLEFALSDAARGIAAAVRGRSSIGGSAAGWAVSRCSSLWACW